MGHGIIGKQHHCGGHKRKANCRFPLGKTECVTHETYCEKHDWLFRTADQSCGKCDVENEKAKKKAEDEKAEEKKAKEKREKAKAKDDHHMHHTLQKKKDDDDDDDEKDDEGPQPKSQNKRAREFAKTKARGSSHVGNKQRQTKKQRDAKRGESKKKTYELGSKADFIRLFWRFGRDVISKSVISISRKMEMKGGR